MTEFNVLVTGNGFDIHHQKKTKYSDFIDFAKKYYLSSDKANKDKQELIEKIQDDKIVETLNNNFNDFLVYFFSYSEVVNGWVDFEKLIENVTKFFKWYIADCVSERHVSILDMMGVDRNKNLIVSSFHKIFRVDGRHGILNNEFKSELFGIDQRKVIECLRMEFDKLCILFETYLSVIEPIIREEKNNWVFKQIKNIKADHVITFNYTNTYKRYGIQKEQITYLHGSLDNKNIVWGFNDDNEKELEFVYFKKYFQCIIKGTEILENTTKLLNVKFCHRGSVECAHIHFFGHSLDKTDEEELIRLLNLGEYVTVYYLDLDDKCEKIMKIIDLLGKEEAVIRIKEKAIVFKQITDDKC